MSHGLMVGRSSVEVSQSNEPLFPFRSAPGKRSRSCFFILYLIKLYFVVTAFHFLCKNYSLLYIMCHKFTSLLHINVIFIYHFSTRLIGFT